LHENAIHGRVGIQGFDQRQKVGLGRGRRKMMMMGCQARSFTRSALVADIDFGRRIVAHQNDGQPRRTPISCSPSRNLGLDALAQALGEGLAIQNARAHRQSPAA
jgi:hypothetical protein